MRKHMFELRVTIQVVLPPRIRILFILIFYCNRKLKKFNICISLRF